MHAGTRRGSVMGCCRAAAGAPQEHLQGTDCSSQPAGAPAGTARSRTCQRAGRQAYGSRVAAAVSQGLQSREPAAAPPQWEVARQVQSVQAKWAIDGKPAAHCGGRRLPPPGALRRGGVGSAPVMVSLVSRGKPRAQAAGSGPVSSSCTSRRASEGSTLPAAPQLAGSVLLSPGKASRSDTRLGRAPGATSGSGAQPVPVAARVSLHAAGAGGTPALGNKRRTAAAMALPSLRNSAVAQG